MYRCTWIHAYTYILFLICAKDLYAPLWRICMCGYVRARKVVGLLCCCFRCFFVWQRDTHTYTHTHIHNIHTHSHLTVIGLHSVLTSQFVSLRRSWPWAKVKAKAKLSAFQSSLCALPFCKHGNWDAIASNKEKHASIPYLQKTSCTTATTTATTADNKEQQRSQLQQPQKQTSKLFNWKSDKRSEQFSAILYYCITNILMINWEVWKFRAFGESVQSNKNRWSPDRY